MSTRRFYMKSTMPVRDRIMYSITVDVDSRCWIWVAGQQGLGYGCFRVPGKKGTKAHRASYEEFVGPIPDGLVLDHLCRNRLCVNPEHLEAVTQQENLLRSPIGTTARNAAKTHCPQGHAYDAANTYRTPNGQRKCRVCQNAMAVRSRARSRARARAAA